VISQCALVEKSKGHGKKAQKVKRNKGKLNRAAAKRTVRTIVGLLWKSLRRTNSCRRARRAALSLVRHKKGRGSVAGKTFRVFRHVKNCAKRVGRRNVARRYRKAHKQVRRLGSKGRAKLAKKLRKSHKKAKKTAKKALRNPRKLVTLFKKASRVHRKKAKKAKRQHKKATKKLRRVKKQTKRRSGKKSKKVKKTRKTVKAHKKAVKAHKKKLQKVSGPFSKNWPKLTKLKLLKERNLQRNHQRKLKNQAKKEK
jgi:hypothetical protein